MSQVLISPAESSVIESRTRSVQAYRRVYNPVQKDAATFLELAEETNGARTLLELEVAPGGGNGLHYHTSFAEHFTAVSGELRVQVGKQEFVLQPGQSAVAPPMALHRWYNPSQQTVTALVELRPGNTGFERSIQIAYGLARDGLMNKHGTPTSMVHLALLVEASDSGLPGIFSMLAPLMRGLAAWGRRRGIERELIERYCVFGAGR